MSEINPNPEDLQAAKEKICEEIMAADEFIVFLHAELPPDENDGEEGGMGVQTVVSASPANYGFFAHAMHRCNLTMAHSVLGEMLGVNDGDGQEDITAQWLHGHGSESEALPDPDTIEVPDFVPDFSDESWNTPGGEFPGKGE